MQLRADEAAVVEKAVRLAIESVMNVLCAVNSARTHELQRLVADRERQIRRLEGRVRETEAELGLLLRPRSAPRSSPGSVPEQRGGGGAEPESGAEQRDCEVRVSLALLTDPPSDLADGAELDQSSSSHSVSEPALCAGQAALCPAEALVPPDQNCPAEEGRVREPARPAERRVKQERLYPSPGRIKLEPLSPDCGPLHLDAQDGPAVVLRRAVSEESPRGQGVLGHAELWPSMSSQAEDPVPVLHAAPVPHSTNVPHSVPVPQTPQTVPWRTRTSVSRRDQSEEAMRRRRASWRAASRRYYARKMARLQNHTAATHPAGLQAHAAGLQTPSTHHQYPPCPGGPVPASHTDSWRYPVCDLAPLHHQPPPGSADVTFMAESDLLSGSLT